MTTQSHTKDSIESWLEDCLKSNRPPREIVIDESGASMGAAVETFTQFSSINEYLDGSMRSLLLDTDDDLPRCYLRLDRSHIVKSIARNVRKGLKQTTRIIRGVLGYLITCSSLKETESILSSLFTLISNRYNSVHVDDAYKALLSLVRTHEISEICEEHATKDEILSDAQKLPKDKTYKMTSNYVWIKDILKAIPIVDAELDKKGNPRSYKTLNGIYVLRNEEWISS